MKIDEMKPGDKNVQLSGKVISVGQDKTVNTRFGPTRLKEYFIEDDSGQVKLVLWGDNANRLRIDDEINISNVKVKEYNNEIQVGLSKKSKINIKNYEMKSTWE